jgi:hypothetical protein
VKLCLAQDPEADQLLSENPSALLIGMVLDQQIPLETAFSGPKFKSQGLGPLPPATSRRSKLGRPTTLATRDQPPAEFSHQKVSGLTGAVHRARPDAGCDQQRVGVPVLVTTQIAAGTGLVLDTSQAGPVLVREGL